jgi:hypothetical protein
VHVLENLFDGVSRSNFSNLAVVHLDLVDDALFGRNGLRADFGRGRVFRIGAESGFASEDDGIGRAGGELLGGKADLEAIARISFAPDLWTVAVNCILQIS